MIIFRLYNGAIRNNRWSVSANARFSINVSVIHQCFEEMKLAIYCSLTLPQFPKLQDTLKIILPLMFIAVHSISKLFAPAVVVEMASAQIEALNNKLQRRLVEENGKRFIIFFVHCNPWKYISRQIDKALNFFQYK